LTIARILAVELAGDFIGSGLQRRDALASQIGLLPRPLA
jgi:hypothetical protein